MDHHRTESQHGRAAAFCGARLALLAAATASGGLAAAQEARDAGPPAERDLVVKARATLEPTQGSDVRGTVDFFEAPDATAVHVTLAGLKPGDHGFHVHENGNCGGPTAQSAGDHWNPGGHPHGGPADAPDARHSGDLGNVKADADGNVDQWVQYKDLDVDGADGVVGKAIIVHEAADDLDTQPSGDSGDPAACGVIAAAGATAVRESSR